MIWYVNAIILITLFHFSAMYFLINSNRLVVKNVKTKKPSVKKKIAVKKTTKKKVVKKPKLKKKSVKKKQK